MSPDPQRDRPPLDLSPTPKQSLELTANEAQASTLSAAESPVAPPAIAMDIERLQAQKATLIAEIEQLKIEKASLIALEPTTDDDIQGQMRQLMAMSLQTLEKQQASLQQAIAKLEKRRDKIQAEMNSTFAGKSQEIAVRVQGFKDYLMGSLQDLAIAAEQLDLPSQDWSSAAPTPAPQAVSAPEKLAPPQFSEQSFAAKSRRIQEMLEQYRKSPDYYGPPWQLRRTFEPIHSKRVNAWFFEQGGRGVIRSIGSRLQNILVASASISVLYRIYGDRLRILTLANTPERLGEWRRGLQDCLGISRSDFGPNSGVILFENPDALVQKADRLVEDNQLPLIVIDEAEDSINLSLLQYPLWLAFAPEPQSDSSYFY